MPTFDRDELVPGTDGVFPPVPDFASDTDTHQIPDMWIDLGGSD